MLADAARCVPMPANLDFAVASSFFVTYGTSYHALNDRAHLKPGETLVVLGAAGGVGFPLSNSARRWARKSSPPRRAQEKVDLAKKHGADDGFVYPTGALSRDQQKALSEDIKRLTGGKGADVLYDPVGGDYAEPALRAMNWEGRYLVIGFAAGEIPRVPLNLTLLKGCDIVGVFWGASMMRDPKTGIANLTQITNWIAEGKLKPHVSARSRSPAPAKRSAC